MPRPSRVPSVLRRGFVVGLLSCLASGVAARPLLEPGERPALDRRVAAQQLQMERLNARPFGLPLDLAPRDEEAAQVLVAAVRAAEGGAALDPRSLAGRDLHALLQSYGQGSTSMFGGVATAALALRLRALRAAGAPAAALDSAREALVRAATALHLSHLVTGGQGVVARGLWRLVPEDPELPPFPGGAPQTVPLRDEQGAPLPPEKDNGTWREDNSGGLLPPATWVWLDSCSKDMLVGYTFGLSAAWDALSEDPLSPPELLAGLAEDAAAVGRMLRQKHLVRLVDGRAAEMDLLILDADGRLTYHSDLNPFALERNYVDEQHGVFNTFNAIMALGIVASLWHVSGDPELEDYLYGELMQRRRYHERVLQGPEQGALAIFYFGTRTNFSVTHMAALALWQVFHLEADDALAQGLEPILEDLWWLAPGSSRTARRARQPFYHLLYLGLSRRGGAAVLGPEALDLLEAFPLAPLQQRAVRNCDEAELAARRCIAEDGSELQIEEQPGRGGGPVATEALWPSIRPSSNFYSRSDPFEVNGEGGLALYPGSDLLAAYWLARLIPSLAAGQRWVSPHARAHRSVEWEEPPGEDLGPPRDLGPGDLGGEDLGGGDLGGGDLGGGDLGGGDLGGGDLGAGDVGPRDLGAARTEDLRGGDGGGTPAEGCACRLRTGAGSGAAPWLRLLLRRAVP